ncbi:hypothetical protein [Streptomyces sp. NPDC002851]
MTGLGLQRYECHFPHGDIETAAGETHSDGRPAVRAEGVQPALTVAVFALDEQRQPPQGCRPPGLLALGAAGVHQQIDPRPAPSAGSAMAFLRLRHRAQLDGVDSVMGQALPQCAGPLPVRAVPAAHMRAPWGTLGVLGAGCWVLGAW